MTRAIVFKKNINNNFKPKLIFIMIDIKNSWLRKALLQNFSSYKVFIWDHLNISQLWVLGSTIYVFLYKEK